MEPLVVPRDQHTLTRREIDPDALKVLYRLKEAGFSAYLVGGGVRDLLLGRRPKDFDIGTDAHPYQIKKLFRNCWIIGRRFRLAHVVFGKKVVEVATFRRQVSDAEMAEAKAAAESSDAPQFDEHQHLIHRDNTFGTAEEDAFRRDFTVNALFYDIATYSIIDYVGGWEDLHAGVIKCIGNPELRFREDPVRMQRAISFAARLEFDIDQPILEAIASHRGEIAKAAPPRLMDEYYKILRTGCARRTFEALKQVGLFEPISPVLHEQAGDSLWASLDRLDTYRRRTPACPESLTNPVLLGSLIVPLGFSQAGWPAWLEGDDKPGLNLGLLPLARKDVERIHQVLMMQRRLREPGRSSPHARRMLIGRAAFADALTWLDIHAESPDLVNFWRGEAGNHGLSEAPEAAPGRRRRRRRRRRRVAEK